MSRRESDAGRVIDALDQYIRAVFRIDPLYANPNQHYEDWQEQQDTRKALAKALVDATGNPEPE